MSELTSRSRELWNVFSSSISINSVYPSCYSILLVSQLNLYAYYILGTLLFLFWKLLPCLWKCRKNSKLHCFYYFLTFWSRQVTLPAPCARLSSRPGRRLSRSPPPFPIYHPEDVEATLDVAVYKTGHWALYLVPPRGRLTSLHQVNNNNDGRGFYVSPARWSCAPRKSRLHDVTIFTGRIRWKHVKRVRRMIDSWPVNNHDPEWICQLWVLEILEELLKRGWLLGRYRGLKRLMGLRHRF